MQKYLHVVPIFLHEVQIALDVQIFLHLMQANLHLVGLWHFLKNNSNQI